MKAQLAQVEAQGSLVTSAEWAYTGARYALARRPLSGGAVGGRSVMIAL